MAGSGALFSGLVYWWSQYVEPYWLELATPEIVCPNLPAELDGLRVLLLADPHVDSWSRREDSLIRMLSHDLPHPPDVVLWGGDIGAKTETGVRLVTAVREVIPDLPTFAVLGNAEHKISRSQTAQFVKGLEGAGVRVLKNVSETLSVRGVPITLAGVDDPYYGYDDLPAALKAAPAERFTILLSHSPQIVYRAAKAGVDLMLSGHTHGGQIRLPFLGALKAQNPLGTKLDQGLFERERLRPMLQGRDIPEEFRLYITRGIGVASAGRLLWLRPRLLCRPEVTLITLRCPEPGTTG